MIRTGTDIQDRTLDPGAMAPLYNANFTDLPVDFAALLRALWRRKVSIFVIWFMFTIGAGYFAFTAQPIFESHAALELKALPALPKSELHSETSMSKVNEKKYMEAMKRLLSSRKLALLTVSVPDFRPDPSGVTSPEEATFALAEDLQSRLAVSLEKGGVTGVINLNFQDPSPARAARVLTVLIEQFWTILYEKPEIAFAKERNHIRQMIDQAQGKLDRAYDDLNSFLSQNDIFFLENIDVMTKKDIEITSSQLLELSKKAEQASHGRILAEAEFFQAQKNPRGISRITESQLIMALKEELAMARANQADLRAVYAPGHSKRKALAARVASLQTAIDEEEENIIQTLAHVYETALTRENDLQTRLETMKQDVIRKKALKGEYDAIEAEIEINRKVYQSVLQQYEALKIETVFPFTLNMIDPPLVPVKPAKPDKAMRIALGMFVGLVFGTALSLLIEFTNPGLRAPVEAERRTGLPLLGALPSPSRHKAFKQMAALEQNRHLTAWPEFNQAFASPVGILLAQEGLCISVTSPREDEGKAMTALGICRQLVRAGKKVILIDADLSAPKLDRLFDLDNAPGLLDILENHTMAERGLDGLPRILESAGGGVLFGLKTGLSSSGSDALSIVETPTFAKVMAQYEKTADYVVLIAPPLLRDVASYIVNRLANTAILVLKERKSKIKDAVRATEMMHRTGISVLGLMVTESDYHNA